MQNDSSTEALASRVMVLPCPLAARRRAAPRRAALMMWRRQTTGVESGKRPVSRTLLAVGEARTASWESAIWLALALSAAATLVLSLMLA